MSNRTPSSTSFRTGSASRTRAPPKKNPGTTTPQDPPVPVRPQVPRPSRRVPTGQSQYQSPPVFSELLNDRNNFSDREMPSMEPVLGSVTPNLPQINPYFNLPRELVEAVARERDLAFFRPNRRQELTGAEMAAQVFEFDHILPDWLSTIRAKDIGNFQTLTGARLYVYGALNGIDFNQMPSIQGSNDLIQFIRAAIILADRNHPERSRLSNLIRSLRRDHLEYFTRPIIGRSESITRFVPDAMLRDILIRGDVAGFDLNALDLAAQRYEILRHHKYRDNLARLYGIHESPNPSSAWTAVARLPPHPMERIILYLDAYTPGQVTKTFGMVIPLAYTGQVERYIRENIEFYAQILTRGAMIPPSLELLCTRSKESIRQTLTYLTDEEIHRHTSIYVPYRSRPDLVRNTSKAIRGRGNRFMYPCIRSSTRSINQQTMLFTDIMEVEVFMVCFGNALKYYSYELQELIGAFHWDEQNNSMEFKHPEAMTLHFTIREIESLKQLLQCFDPSSEIQTLVQRIDQGIIYAREKIGYDDTARAQLDRLNPGERNWVREFLRQLLHIGMYMRRWRGPGHPYPLHEIETKRDWDPMLKVQDEMMKGRGMLDQMGSAPAQYCMGLRMCEYTATGTIEQHGGSIESDWNRVATGNFCIRMASSKFVGTSLHFLRALFRENITGIDTTAVARIV